MSMARIQVLLSAYNGEKYIEKQIDSIFSQVNVEVHCKVRDDGSSDKTLKILKGLCESYHGLELVNGKNLGFAKSFFELVVSDSEDYDYYAFSDQDDVWLMNKLETAILGLGNRSNRPKLYFCNAILVDEHLNPLGKMHDVINLPNHKIERLMENLAPGCTMVFNKAARDYFIKANRDTIEYHDAWLYTFCSYLGEVVYDRNPYILYRQHAGNLIGNQPNIKKLWGQRIMQIKKRTHLRENLASEMLRLYSDLLESNDKKELLMVSQYRLSLLHRMKFFFSKAIKMSSYKKLFWLKIHILLGNV